MAKMRLDKFLADMGAGTRSSIRDIIRNGRIQVNKITVILPESKVDSDEDMVTIDGKLLKMKAYEYYMLNKPQGVVSAVTDKHDKTVVQLITASSRKGLFPIGRLDKDTEGLLVITNDGALEHRLLSPKKHVDKVYYARVEGCVTGEDIRTFAEGMKVDDSLTAMPAELKIISAGEISEVTVKLQEGKFHQVKRMFSAVGKEVVYLKRLSMGGLVLDESLKPGEFRELTDEELALLDNGAV